jgi:hypothetical protein
MPHGLGTAAPPGTIDPAKCGRTYPVARRWTVDSKNSFNVSIGQASVQVTYALLHLWEIPRFVNPRSKGIASA